MKNYCHAKRALKFNNQRNKYVWTHSTDVECCANSLRCNSMSVDISKVIEDHWTSTAQYRCHTVRVFNSKQNVKRNKLNHWQLIILKFMVLHLFYKPKWNRNTNKLPYKHTFGIRARKLVWASFTVEKKWNKWFKLVHFVKTKTKTKTQNYPTYTPTPHTSHIHT